MRERRIIMNLLEGMSLLDGVLFWTAMYFIAIVGTFFTLMLPTLVIHINTIEAYRQEKNPSPYYYKADILLGADALVYTSGIFAIVALMSLIAGPIVFAVTSIIAIVVGAIAIPKAVKLYKKHEADWA
jgi:hypothetical protein